MRFALSSAQILSPAYGDEELYTTYVQVTGYHMQVVKEAIEGLSDPTIAIGAIEQFIVALRLYPETIQTRRATLAESDPEQLMQKILINGLPGFTSWLKKMKTEEASFHNAIVGRCMYHYFRLFSQGEEDLGTALEKMKAEFSNIDFSAKTLWLSRIINTIQVCVFEAYVVGSFVEA